MLCRRTETILAFVCALVVVFLSVIVAPEIGAAIAARNLKAEVSTGDDLESDGSRESVAHDYAKYIAIGTWSNWDCDGLADDCGG